MHSSNNTQDRELESVVVVFLTNSSNSRCLAWEEWEAWEEWDQWVVA